MRSFSEKDFSLFFLHSSGADPNQPLKKASSVLQETDQRDKFPGEIESNLEARFSSGNSEEEDTVQTHFKVEVKVIKLLKEIFFRKKQCFT